ncbi:MAG: rhomboid family intramembrane serine protease [Bacteroidales bacterium]|nr:rhomboid family intramembrane serine protease [Bacteroidales bacterium]MBN2634468.1 rhomboid family intramembrane serine protease [Bacteroidales bacterium]
MTDHGSDILSEGAFYRKKFFLSILIPSIFVALMWLVKAVELLFDLDISRLGIYPLQVRGLPGIVTSPFIHSDLKHLFNNSLPLFLLAVALFFFYSEVALKVFSLTYLITGLFVWLGGRNAWHIGASGLVYGLASFLFFSGIIRKYYRLIALSLLIVFLYGEMVWGIFPGVYQNVSWESHMLGVFSGIFLAVFYRKEGPQAPVQIWPDDEEEEDTGQEEEDRGKNLNKQNPPPADYNL